MAATYKNCTNRNDAREYFKNKDLCYDNVTEGDILALVMMLNQEIKEAVKAGEGVPTLRLSEKIDKKMTSKGTLIFCNIYVNSHYFTRRECISFNENGYIGFAGWADDVSVAPIARAFTRWCDYLGGQI